MIIIEGHTQPHSGQYALGVYKISYPYYQRIAHTMHSNWLVVEKDNSILKEPRFMLFLLFLKLYENDHNLSLNAIQKLVNNLC